MSYTNLSVPTCGSDFKLLSPYDSDLQTAFNSKLEAIRTKSEKNTCGCKTNMNALQYTQDLSNCVQCLETGSYPNLSQAWGCDTCENIVAPVSYHEMLVSKNTTITLADADKLQLYVTPGNEAESYRIAVNSDWNTVSPCEKGMIIKALCIDSPNYKINIPPAPQPENTGNKNNEPLSKTSIILIVVIGIVGIAVLIFLIWWFKKDTKSSQQKSSNEEDWAPAEQKPAYDRYKNNDNDSWSVSTEE
jgi:hypothetical protein